MVELRTSLQNRQVWLRREGYPLDANGKLTNEAVIGLKIAEWESAVAKESKRTGMAVVEITNGSDFRGRYSYNIELAQGRFAVIKGTDGFVLAKVSNVHRRWLGQDISLRQSGRNTQWQTVRTRLDR